MDLNHRIVSDELTALPLSYTGKYLRAGTGRCLALWLVIRGKVHHVRRTPLKTASIEMFVPPRLLSLV